MARQQTNSLQDATNIYSTSEQAVGVWVDGKTIYRKSFTGTTSLPGAHGITGLDSMLRIDAMVKDGSGAWRPVPWTFNAGSYASVDPWNAGVSINSTNMSWQLGTSIGSFTQNRVTLWYTR